MPIDFKELYELYDEASLHEVCNDGTFTYRGSFISLDYAVKYVEFDILETGNHHSKYLILKPDGEYHEWSIPTIID